MNLLDAVRLELTQVNSNKTRKWNDIQIYYFIDKAQVRFVLSKVKVTEQSDHQHDIIDYSVVQPFIKIKKYALDTNLEIPINLNFIVSSTLEVNGKKVRLRLYSDYFYSLHESLPYYSSNVKSLIGKIEDNKITIKRHKKEDVITNVELVYIKNIELISDVNPKLEVKEIYYKSVIDLAVLAAMETTSNSASQEKERDITKNITIT